MATDGGEVFVQGPGKVPLVGVDLKTGETRNVLPGNWADKPTGMAYDAVRDRILVVESADDRVVAIDPATGAMSVASPPSLASGSTVGTKRGLVVDGDSAYALGNGGAWIVRIDLGTGERTTTRIQVPISGARDLALDKAGGRLIVADTDSDGVARVDLATGAVTRETAKLIPLGTGPRVERPVAVFCDPGRLRIIVLDRDPRRLVAIDCPTADREELHAIPADVMRIDLLPDGDGAVVVQGKQAVSVDASGATAALTLDNFTRGVVYDHQRESAFVTTTYTLNNIPMGVLRPVDPAAGTLGAGEPIVVNTLPAKLRPRLEVTGAMAYDRQSGAIYLAARHVTTQQGSILVRNAEGDIRAVTGVWAEGESTMYRGGTLADPTGIAVDAAHGRLLIVRWDKEEVVEVDLATGNRKTLSGKHRGVGPRIGLPGSIDVDPAANVAYVASTKGVLAIDLETGDRVLLTG
jgi:DNA-binding beta-propeller fold protein YncE